MGQNGQKRPKMTKNHFFLRKKISEKKKKIRKFLNLYWRLPFYLNLLKKKISKKLPKPCGISISQNEKKKMKKKTLVFSGKKKFFLGGPRSKMKIM